MTYMTHAFGSRRSGANYVGDDGVDGVPSQVHECSSS
jgi:hypothetical protein